MRTDPLWDDLNHDPTRMHRSPEERRLNVVLFVCSLASIAAGIIVWSVA